MVRQESAFEAFVSSSAGARGLMQVMPATGDEIAAELDWPDYTSQDLYRPLVSLEFGAHYISKWQANLEGDIFAALAAYNGGPGNAIELKKLAPNDPDLFVEIIPFELSETRTYIQRIYELFVLYRRVYDRSP
jgi:soluble lytic murein transglycosylase